MHSCWPHYDFIPFQSTTNTVIAGAEAYGQTYGAHGAYGAKGAEGAEGVKVLDGLLDRLVVRSHRVTNMK